MKNAAHIAVEATAWQNQRGYGRHIRALFSALVGLAREHRYTFLVDSIGQDNPIWPDSFKSLDNPYPQDVDIRLVHSSKPATIAASAQSRRSFVDMFRMSLALSGPQFDLILFPTIYSFVPVISHARKIVFIHDVIADRYPQYTLPKPSSRIFWNLKVFLGRQQADGIITVSEYSRRKLIEHFNINPQNVSVVGEASDPIFQPIPDPYLTPVLQQTGIPKEGRLIVYVGGFGPHKNLTSLIHSFTSLARQPQYDDISLILVGKKQQETFFSEIEHLESLANESGLNTRIIFTGFLPDEELVILLNRAAVLVLPSLMEGFGLPAVEAAACGCPVIATKESPLPELLGQTGIYFDPYQPDELTDALEKVLTSTELRSHMRQAGLVAASQLTWESAAQQLMSIINHTLEKDS